MIRPNSLHQRPADRPLALLLCLATLILANTSARLAAQGDGPRAYFPAPIDMNLVAGYGMFIDGNKSLDPGAVIKGGDLSLNIGVAQYTRTLAAGKNAVAVFAIVPAGEVSGTVRIGPNAPSQTSSGTGDLMIGGVLGLFGSPAMDLQEFMQFNPETSLGILAKLGLPTGAYSSSQVINLGTNRFSLQLGAPFSYVIGETLLDDNLTTIDILPSFTFFSDNDEPFGGSRLEQDMLFLLEAHLTHNVNRAIWLSLDTQYSNGAETTMDGVAGDNAQEALSLGGSVGVNLSRAFSVELSYGEVVTRNDDGPDGNMFRIVGSLVF